MNIVFTHKKFLRVVVTSQLEVHSTTPHPEAQNWEAKAIESEAVDCMVALEYMESVVVGQMVINMEGYLVTALYHTFQTL